MAKPGTMPSKDVIDGFKGKLDFYYWKGTAVARMWPTFKPYKFSPAQLANQAAFSYVNKLWSSLDISVKIALSLMVAQTTLTAKDLYVRSYMKGAFPLMPPEYYATEATQLALLAQLDVALSTRALEAGGNLADIHARLDAIKLIQEDLVFVVRSGALAHGAGFSDLLDISGKGILERVEMTSDVTQADLRLTMDGQDFRLIEPDGSGVQWVRHLTLYQLGGDSAFWKQSLYDTVNDLYALYLKDPIQYNSALYIGYRQLSGGAANVAVTAYYRPLT